jgi:hypothetical protein
LNRNPTRLATAPNNVWTRLEFETWIDALVKQEIAARGNAPPLSDTEVASLMKMIVHSLNTGIVPAGNA